jgi:hypothetical protein
MAWNEYWIPLEVVIEFKRDVYQMALTELARFCRGEPSTTGICARECVRTIAMTRSSGARRLRLEPAAEVASIVPVTPSGTRL